MSDSQFDERIYGPLNDRQLLWSVYEKLQDALNSANLPDSLNGSLSAAAYSVAELHWRLFDERIGLKSLTPVMTVVSSSGNKPFAMSSRLSGRVAMYRRRAG